MTIPIIPGPFAFLAGAGEALGAYGAQREEHRRYAQTQAQKAIEHMDNLVQLGILPAKTMESQEAQHLFSVAGYGGVQQGATLPQPREQMQRLTAGELGGIKPGTTEARLATKLPTAGQAAREDVAAQARRGLTPEQARAAEGIPGAEEAGAGEVMRAERERLTTEITTGARKLIGDDPQAARLAEEAALGILPYRIQQLSINRAYMSEERARRADNTRLLLGALSDITRNFNNELDEWTRSRSAALADYSKPKLDASGNISQPTAEEVDTFGKAWEKANPKPNYDASADTFLDSVYGMTRDEFSEYVRGGLELGGTRSKKDKRPAGATAPPPGPDPQQRKIGGSIRQLSTGDPTQNGASLGRHTKAGDYTELEARMILTHLRRSMTADQYAKLQAAYDEAIK